MKKIISFFLAVLMIGSLMPVTAEASNVLIITQPNNWEWISKSDPPNLKWSKISGAAGYTVTVKNDETGEYYTQNEWTTKTQYNLLDLFDSTLGYNDFPRLKIWVGAMKSTDISQGLINLDAQDSIIAVVSDPPVIKFNSCTDITNKGATLKMTISKDCGSDIEDCGFYIGYSSTVGSMTKYSFKDYGSESVTTKGTKTMTVENLNPGTKYSVRAYAVNAMGETVSSSKNFTTNAEEDSLQISKNTVSWNYTSENEEKITVTCSESFEVDDVYYKLSSEPFKDGHNCEWLDVNQSGNTIILKPTRPNYSKHERTAEVTVVSGSQTKDIVVKQAACEETAPTMTIKRGNTVITDGMNLGAFTVGQSKMEATIVSSNVRKVSAQLRSTSGLMALDTSTDLNIISLDISDLETGDYKVTVYASNSDTANDYWSQSPFSGGDIEFYFSLVEKSGENGDSGNESDSGSGNMDLSNNRFNNMGDSYLTSSYYNNLKSIKLTGDYAQDMITIAKSQVGYVESSNGASAYGLFWGNNSSWCAHFIQWCAQLAGVVDDKVGELDENDLFTGTGGAASPYSMLKDYKFEVWYFYINNNGGIKYSSTTDLSWKTYSDKVHNMTGVNDGDIPCEGTKDSFAPIKGDLIYFRPSSGTDRWGHVGLVDKVENGYVYFYDGNGQGNGEIVNGQGQNNGVAYRRVSNNNNLITAYARPDYVESTETKTTYTITYDANGGSGAPASQKKQHNVSINLSSVTPIKSGYTFCGWSDSISSAYVQYQPGAKYSSNSDITLFALWKRNTTPSTGNSSFNIDDLAYGAPYHTSANLARIMENENIFTAHFYAGGSEGSAPADERLRERSSAMVYQHLADIEKENGGRLAFSYVWSALNFDTEKFSGLKETDFYSAILWKMITGEVVPELSIESTMEDYEKVVDECIVEFADWYSDEIIKEEKDVLLNEWSKVDSNKVSEMSEYYKKHYEDLENLSENRESFFDDLDELSEYSSVIIKFCDTPLEYLTKMSQIEALYGTSHNAYLRFLEELANGSNTDYQLKIAARNLISLMSCSDYEEALDLYMLQLVREDCLELFADDISGFLEEVVSDVLKKNITNATLGTIITGIKLGMEAADLLLGVEDILAARYNILLLSDMTDAVFDTSARLRKEYYDLLDASKQAYIANNFQNMDLSLTANAYVASIELCHRFLLQTNTYSEEYVDQNYSKYWNMQKDVLNSYHKTLESEKNSLNTSYKNVLDESHRQYHIFYDQVVNDIIFVADGFNNVPETIEKELWRNVVIPKNIPTHSRYTFKYWMNLDTGVIYYPGEIFKENYSDDTVLHAIFEEENVIIFDSNNGQGSPAPIVNTGSITIPNILPKRNNYSFVGWSMIKSIYGYKAEYTPGETYSFSEGTHILYAVWKPNKFDVIFDANGGMFKNAKTDTIIKQKEYNVGLNIDVEKPIREGYEFAGVWSLTKDGTGKRYNHNEIYSDIGDSTSNSKKLYAVWEKKVETYTITYEANGGANAPTVHENNVGDTTLSTQWPSREGYTFMGWSVKKVYESGDMLYAPGASFPTDGNVTLYAIWQKNAATYTVTYNANGGSGAPATQTKTENVALTLSNTKPTRNGYTFKGWATSSTATTAQYQPGDSYTANADVTLYAVWKKNTDNQTTYTVKYNANGGSGAPSTQTKTEGKTLTLSSTKPTRSGYTFQGWATTANATTAQYQPGAKYTANSNVTLYAVWKAASKVVPGDGNEDGTVDILDLILLRQYVAEMDVEININAMDVNNDGIVDILDLILLRQYIAEMDVELI